MNNLFKKIITFGLTVCMALSVFGGAAHAVEADAVVILYENDVHCAVEGYSKLAAMKKELAETYANVGVVSCGDFVQGGTLGAVSKGEYIVKLMNKVGYDAIGLGNHEFDYQLPRLMELNDLSDTKFTSCNFQKLGEDRSCFDPYTLVSYGDVDIAYIGITTPETINSSSPAQFRNESGELIYTFNEANLSEVVQTNIDAARAAGADYVIALSHIGYAEDGSWSDITDVIGSTDGFDAVLDAHSHSVIEKKMIKDKSGDEVLLTSTGTKFAYIGQLTITPEGLDSRLVEVESYEKTDADVDAYIAEINDSYAELGNRKIGESKVELITDDADGNRLVRNNETNLGDFCSDALRVVTGADIGFVNGGGLRAPMASGDVTFNDIFSVFPFNNQVVTVEVTGQILLDMLEMGVMNYPEEDGSFPHMSGVTFSVNKSIPSSVQLDENGFFVKVDGAYRVYNVKVLNQQSGAYEELKPDGKYVMAGFNYFLIDFGGGMSMFKDATLIDAEGTLDVEMLETYIVEHLGGVIGEDYAQVTPNITFTDGETTDMIGDTAPQPEEETNPKTGEDGAVFLWAVLAGFGLCGVAALELCRRKNRPVSG